MSIDKVFFDLDGTLINPRKRLYTLFTELSGSSIGFDDYWKYKDSGKNQRQMLEIVNYKHSHQCFCKIWLKEIERKDLLFLDEIFSDVPSGLASIKAEGIKMYIVTNRQSYENLEWELNQIGISDYFEKIITTFQKCSKDEAVIKAGVDVTSSLFVGDSKEDMEAASALGIRCAFLQRNNKKKNIIADYYVDDFDELRGILF